MKKKTFRYHQLAETLEKEIQDGVYPVGTKIPSERELSKRFEAGNLTVRQGLEILLRKGLLRREHGSGTYVCGQVASPGLAILFGPSMTDESSHFYRALLGALEVVVAHSPFTCRSYDGFNRAHFEKAGQVTAFLLLERDTNIHPVHGVLAISVNDRRWLAKPPFRHAVCVRHGEVDCDVMIDYGPFGSDVVRLLAARGRKRVLYLRSFLNPQNDLGAMGDTAKALGFPMPVVVPLSDDSPGAEINACRTVEALARNWKKNPAECPDAIVVSDDIATRGVALALIRAGIRVPTQTLVITLANKGIDHHYGVPVLRHLIHPNAVADGLMATLRARLEDAPAHIPLLIASRWETPPDANAHQFLATHETT